MLSEDVVSQQQALEVARDLHACAVLLARVAGRSLAALDVTWPQALSLLLLSEHAEPVNATWLVQQLGLGRTAMTAVVDRLERRGWLVRRPHPRDRRVSDLALTDAGRRLAARIARTTSETLTPLLAGAPAPAALNVITEALTQDI